MWSLQKVSLAVLLLALAGGFRGDAQTVTQGDGMYLRMREVGEKLRCQCEGSGGCSYTVANCNMLHCSFREQVNPEIRKSLEAGMAPDAIVAAMIARFGSELRTEPLPQGFGLFGWAMPFAALALGLVIVPFVVRRWKQKQRLAEEEHRPIPEQVLAEYEAAIERDLAESE
jgi:cytochrome c-type biogenesis protein CcmH/NrfF